MPTHDLGESVGTAPVVIRHIVQAITVVMGIVIPLYVYHWIRVFEMTSKI